MKKQPSGYQNRKKAKEKIEQARAEGRAEALAELSKAESKNIQKFNMFPNSTGVSNLIAPLPVPQSPQEFKQHVELPIYGIKPPAFVNAVEQILAQHEQGVFFASAQFCDSILRDDMIFTTLETRINGIVCADTEIEPSNEMLRARKVAENVEDNYEYIFPQAQVGELLRWGRLLGVGVAEVVYETIDGKWMPRIKIWHPKFLRWDWLSRKYKLITEDRGEITLERDDPQWVIYEPYGTELPWLRAMIRPLAMPYLIRTWTRQWWARGQEVSGTPIRLGIVPPEIPPEQEQLFLQQLYNLASNAVVRLPQGVDGNRFDLKLLEAHSDLYAGFEALLKHCDESISRVILGQHMTTMGLSGLGDKSAAGEATRLDIKHADANTLSETLRNKVLKFYCDVNFGDAKLAPYICFQVDPPEDTKSKAEEIRILAEACVRFKEAGAMHTAEHLNMRELFESLHLPLLDEAEMQHHQEMMEEMKEQEMPQMQEMPKKEVDNQLEEDDEMDAG